MIDQKETRIDRHGFYAEEPPVLTMREVTLRPTGVYVRDVAFDLRKAEDREKIRQLMDVYECPPRRSEDGPYTTYFRQLKAEREDRLGRIERHESAPCRAPDARATA